MKTKIIFISVFCLLLLTMSTAAFSQDVTLSGAPAPYAASYNKQYRYESENYWYGSVFVSSTAGGFPFYNFHCLFRGTRFVPGQGDVYAWYFGNYPALWQNHHCPWLDTEMPFYNENTCLPPPATGWRYVATGELVQGMVLNGLVTATNEAPVADAGADQTFDCAPAAGLSVTLDGSGSSDPDDDDLTYTWTGSFGTASGVEPTVALTPGVHTITLTVDDGTDTDDDEVVVTINADTEAPDITVATEVLGLWPPNHKYTTFTLADFDVSVSDNCECADLEATIAYVTSDEPDDAKGGGDGNTTDDIVMVDDYTVKLRAERDGGGDGRVYTITISATDYAGNIGTASCQVIVPHDRKGLPKNIGNQFVSDDTVMPEDYQLRQNYPNPFNPTTEITFALPKAETVKLSIYNTNGQLIRTLVDGFYSEGFHSIMWNATDESGSRVSSGMYMYVLRAGETVLQDKMLLMK